MEEEIEEDEEVDEEVEGGEIPDEVIEDVFRTSLWPKTCKISSLVDESEVEDEH